MKRFITRLTAPLIGAATAIGLLSGCADSSDSVNQSLDRVVLQTDWFPQPEHGGFYQALANGYYEEAGLEVTILSGGPNSMSTQKVLSGRAHFAMNRADTIYSLAARQVPVSLVMATLQHDPQAILLHRANPINAIEDLNQKAVMAVPGLNWIKWVEAKYNISLEIIPHDFGLDRFLNDPSFIQQCLLTNEPFYAQQAGFQTKILPLRDSGFDPYHGLYCLNSLIDENPDLVERFVRASIQGWKDFINNDPQPALSLIAERNPKMNAEFMAFSYSAIKENKLVRGDANKVGQLDPARLQELVLAMESVGICDPSDRPDQWFSTLFCNP